MKRVLCISISHDAPDITGIRSRRLIRRLPEYGWAPVLLQSDAWCSQDSDHERIRVSAPDLPGLYRRLCERSPERRQEPPTLPGGDVDSLSRRSAEQVRGEAGSHPVTSEIPNRDIRISTWLNRWLMFPDKYWPWRGPAIRAALRRIEKGSFNLIFSSSPPRINWLVARDLQRRTGIPCVLEIRDLWTGSPYQEFDQPTALHRFIHRRMERTCIRSAARVSAVCRGLAEQVTSRYGAELKAPVALQYNFYDPVEWEGLTPRAPLRERPFTLSYVGALYTRRSPSVFWEGLAQFLKQYKLGPDDFRFRWAGAGFGLSEGMERIRSLGIDQHVECTGPIPHRAALQILLQSDAALVIQAPGDRTHIPAKLFEAMGARVPVLLVANPCETAEIVQNAHAGIVAVHDPALIAQALDTLTKHIRSDQPWPFDETVCRRYSAERAAEKLTSLFEETAAVARRNP